MCYYIFNISKITFGGYNMAKNPSESEVELKLIKNLTTTKGYTEVKIKNYEALVNNFRVQLAAFNAKKLIEKKGEAIFSDSEFARLMLKLDDLTVHESARISSDQIDLVLDNGEIVYLEFLSLDINRNIYQVTHQVRMEKNEELKVKRENRYDVTILINGLPFVQIELKKPAVEINEAVNQINTYRRKSFRGLFHFIRIFVVSNMVSTKYFANMNEFSPSGKLQKILKSLVFWWSDENNNRIHQLEEFADSFLKKFMLTEMLIKYFIIKKTTPELMVMRPYQVFAVKEAYRRVNDCRMNGYVYHTTGSGKTLTSYKLATLLRDTPDIKKVFFLVDRSDLDEQTVEEYNSFELGCVDTTNNTKRLTEDLQDAGKPMIVTTIQKMATALRKDKYTEIMDTYKEENCVFIIDECHRSQFGKMHGQIKKHFRKANYIGFTGTPIFSQNKGPNGLTTDTVFAPTENYNPNNNDRTTPRPCIHRYMIKEAIADGNVLKYSVEYMRNVSDNEMERLGLDIDKMNDKKYVAEHKDIINAFYHNDARIQAISDDILKNLDRHINIGQDKYTAIFAVDSIATLMKYYRYMKQHNPLDYKIAAIFTYAPNEDLEDEEIDDYSLDELEVCINDYNKIFNTSFAIDTFADYRKDISNRMKQKCLPQIDLLLVVNMFLTGFDSRATNTLILDKNLIWHTLLQAYSRTNRVGNITKAFGQVITYRNIKKQQDNALKLYSGDGEIDSFLERSYDNTVLDYMKAVDVLRDIALTGDEAGYLVDEESQHKFILAFRKVSTILAKLKTFSRFDWEDINSVLDEAEYSIYKNWYLEFYEKVKIDKISGKMTPLGDIDFNIELVRTDRINVIYIINLLKDVLKNDPEKRQAAIDLILVEMDKSDNENLRQKRGLLRAFIEERFFKLKPDTDIFAEYTEFENKQMMKDVSAFARKNNLSQDIVRDILLQYMLDTASVTKNYLKDKLDTLDLDLIAMTKSIMIITSWCIEMYAKYTREED